MGRVALLAGGLLASCWLMTGSSTAGESQPDGWTKVPEILRRIVPPQFPGRELNVTNFGAAAGGTAMCTKAFREAIKACTEAGGGTVMVPAGKYLSGPIHLRSGVNLHLSEGAEICFSDEPEDYLPVVLVRGGGVEFFNYSPLIYARDCVNVAVTGKGKLNGNAKRWWDWKSKEVDKSELMANRVPLEKRVFGKPADGIRPSFVCFLSCTNVLLEDFTIGSGPNWTIHPIYCLNTTIRRLNVITDGPNNDGIDPDSCRDMLIEGCTFDTGDDCVVLKSGSNEDAWRVGRPTENVIMRRCSARRGHGGLVIGSEMSGDVRNVFMEDCQFDGTDRAIRIKSKRGRGGVVENVYARNVTAKNLLREVVILNMDYGADRTQAANEKPPIFRKMEFENIAGDGSPGAITIQGLADSPIEAITFRGLEIASTRGVTAKFVKDLVFERARLRPAKGPVFELDEAVGAILRSVRAPGSVEFLQVVGKTSRGIRVQNADVGGGKPKLKFGNAASPEAVTIE